MDTNEHLRKRAARLVKLGFSQKILAAKMNMAPSTFSKWVNKKPGIGPASVTALDGFYRYIQEVTNALAAPLEDALPPHMLGSRFSETELEHFEQKTEPVRAAAAAAGESTPAKRAVSAGTREDKKGGRRKRLT
jgi:transcriptional regulator with XRE-family HTH domain